MTPPSLRPCQERKKGKKKRKKKRARPEYNRYSLVGQAAYLKRPMWLKNSIEQICSTSLAVFG